MTNPLIEYKKKSGKEWTEISELTGITLQGLYSLCRKNTSDLGLVRLETAVRLKKIDIDLIQYIKVE